MFCPCQWWVSETKSLDGGVGGLDLSGLFWICAFFLNLLCKASNACLVDLHVQGGGLGTLNASVVDVSG